MATVTVCSDFGAQEEEICHYFHLFPASISYAIMGPDAMILVLFCFLIYLVLSLLFHSPPSPSSRSSLVPPHFVPLEWYYLHIWGCWYFSHLFWFPACNSSSPAFLMMCSVYKWIKQGDNKQPCHTPFAVLHQPVVPYRILIVASWLAYRFLRRQVR